MPEEFTTAMEPATPYLGHEKLDVYRAGIEFLALATEVIDALQAGSGVVRDQLDRASLSIVLNIAEGAGKASIPDRRRFYTIARGSAMECGAILDAMKIKGRIDDARHEAGKRLLVRIVQMLTRM